MPEVTALGAAKAAGVALGIRMDQQLAKLTTFKPAINTEGVCVCVCVCVCVHVYVYIRVKYSLNLCRTRPAVLMLEKGCQKVVEMGG